MRSADHPGMRTLAILLLGLTLGCRTPAPPPATPSTPPLSPPPLPVRAISAAAVTGEVLDRSGMAVDGALVQAQSGGVECEPAEGAFSTFTDAAGRFSLVVERGVGPEEQGCVVLNAGAGGAAASVRIPATFTSIAGDPRRELHATLRLGAPPPLDRATGERLIALLDAGMRGDHEAMRQLDLYIRGDLGRVLPIVNAHASWLRGIRSIEPIDAEDDQRLRWRLTGAAGRSVTITLHRENLLELHGPLVDYGDRAAAFVQRIVDLAHAGDPERMARLLDPDDVPVSRETAQRLIDRLRARFDLPRASVTLVGVDEAGHVLRYAVRGSSRTGEQSEEILEVGYGDGLVALRGIH